MADRLFVYGTLHPDRAPAEIASLVRQFREIGRGVVYGRRYDLGAYPGVVLEPEGELVEGTVFELPSDPQLLVELDAYEGFYPRNPEQSLFVRVRTEVAMADGSTCLCWVYVWNRA